MPKQQESESVLHDWVHKLTFQMQALLLTAMRGPDENNKHNAAKAIIRYLRGVVCKPAGDWDRTNNNDFMWGEYVKVIEKWHQHERKPDEHREVFQQYAYAFWEDHDEYPHHFIMHLVHCAQVVGYKHPDVSVSQWWGRFYLDACDAFHMNPETEKEMDRRLNDFGCGFHHSNTKP